MHIRRFATLLVPCASLLACPGCNIVGPAFVILHGPEKLPAEYKLDKEKKTVVFIDDRSNVMSRRSIRLRIASQMEKTMAAQGVVLELVRSQAIMAAATQDSHDDPRSIAELGSDVGAQVVVYATVDSFGLSVDGATYQPTAQFRVKVIDTETGDRLWPDQPEGYQLLVQMRVRPEDMPTTMSDVLVKEGLLAEWSGDRLAELFYAHVKPYETRVGDPQGQND